jgi:Carboxypeptidase regulatory-like domain
MFPPEPESLEQTLVAASSDADSGAGSGNVGDPVQPCQGPAPAPPVRPPSPPVPGNLIVTVINDDDNTPVSGITVEISGPQSATAKTDASGIATFRGIATGAYTVTHSDPCFTSASTGATVVAAQTARAELRVRHIHTVAAVQQLTFTGNNVVEKDTTGNFPSPEWIDTRAQADQSPVSYARNKNIAFTAKFKVTTHPCRSEAVEIKGTASFGSTNLEWTGSVTVNPGDNDFSLALTSNNPLPNEVGIFETSDISWQINPGKQGWAAAGTSRNLVYVTLDNPSGTPNYWTLLDVSCRAAHGQTTTPGLISQGFTGLTGRAVSRKRDSQNLTYWNPLLGNHAQSTAQLLQAANGAGECGSWAEFLIDMYKVHGITSAHKILIVRTKSAWAAGTEGFLVKHWIFDHPPASDANAYTHSRPAQCRPGANLPGQRNSTPPPAFFNHFIVLADGKFWDPSYGAGPFADQSAWENAAIDGLFSKGPPQRAGFDKSLNSTNNLLEFWDLSTNSKI